MALLQCRNCAAQISSDERVTRCKGCGALFPFECDVCARNLRPPFPVYADERYLDEAERPLCSDHFQRQCPSCQTWFRADENSGYFMCKACLEAREAATLIIPETLAVAAPIAPTAIAHASAPLPGWNQDFVPSLENDGLENEGARDAAATLLFSVVCLAILAVIGVLIWQVVSLLRLMTGA